MKVKALLFDTRSIQRYIFSGNRLRTNIGASYIVDHLFDEVLAGILEERFPGCDAKKWRELPVEVRLEHGCQLAYAGGGNAMVLFPEDVPEARIHGIVTEFTERLLTEAPGLRTGVAIGGLELDTSYKADIRKLYQKLKHNQNTVQPEVSLPYTGLTLACEVNGEAANYYGSVGGDKARFMSQETACKEKIADKANKALKTEYQAVLGGASFPMSIDQLGQVQAENYIAIVHADGNRMGKRFENCDGLVRHASLSKKVREKTKAAFGQLLAGIVSERESYKAKGLKLFVEEDGTVELPIRPIIIGGDDITFVCAGRMGLTYAKRFLESMLADEDTDKRIDCCAGMAILPTSYPFFRGYELAEQLCDAAKAKSRSKEGTSWLDFALLHGEQAPTLGQIRQQEYTGAWVKDLHFGPYQVKAPESHFSLDKLISLIGQLRCQPSTKVKELRGVLQRGKHDLDQYKEQQAHLGQHLSEINGWKVYTEDIVDENTLQTPFVDAIEMMDFMPKEEK